MPSGHLEFGFSSTPGASAAILRKEFLRATTPVEPELVIVLAPGNNLTMSSTTEQAGKEFTDLIRSVQHRWIKVIVTDFPTRLIVDFDIQELLRQEYHRCAVSMKERYLSTADHFPVSCSDLWCIDGIHLRDDRGMPLLAQLIWCVAYLQLTRPAITGIQSRNPGITPRLVVRGTAHAPRKTDPFSWAEVKQKGRTKYFLRCSL
ncbi:hypothetical protein HHUSO_G31213 [Huso huso]|uniref:SGNH hydrolase-type esterase domain-containing protein n=1 Tax=Huso huso TaxID=61971 RepID=A0ABR0YCV6_HUSHU